MQHFAQRRMRGFSGEPGEQRPRAGGAEFAAGLADGGQRRLVKIGEFDAAYLHIAAPPRL